MPVACAAECDKRKSRIHQIPTPFKRCSPRWEFTWMPTLKIPYANRRRSSRN